MSSSAAAATVEAHSDLPAFDVFEFFAGVGGFHMSLPTGLKVHSLTAVEIDRRAAECYRFNLHRRREEVGEAAEGTTQPNTLETPSATTTDPGMSARARMKANRKIFFEKQREAAAAGGAAGVDLSEAQSSKRQKVDKRKHIPLVEPSSSSTTSSIATPASVPEDDVGSSSSNVAKRLIATTPMSSFGIPAPTSDRRDIIHSSTPPKLLVKLVEQLSPESLVSKDRSTIWCMSPPCQPFTQTKHSKQLGTEDKRNTAFEWILTTLESLEHSLRPAYLFLENVKHFYQSPMQQKLLETLKRCGYTFEQYLISPIQIGIPNNRMRFYLAAKKLTEEEVSNMTDETWKEMFERLQIVPPGYSSTLDEKAEAKAFLEKNGTHEEDDAGESIEAGQEAPAATVDPSSSSSVVASIPKPSDLPLLTLPSRLSPYLDPPSWSGGVDALTLPPAVLSKPYHLSVVSPFDRKTFCVTGGYGKVVHTSSGSFLLFKGPAIDAGHALTEHPLDKSAGWQPYQGMIRWFSPYELTRLFGFPDWYRFPSHFTPQQCYKLIGNGINMSIVRGILRHHLAEVCGEETQREIAVQTILRR